MKILHYTITSFRLACSLPLLIACINLSHIFIQVALTCETIVPLWLRTDKFYIFFLINTRI